LEKGDQVIEADVPKIRLALIPSPVEAADIDDLGEAPQGDAVTPAKLDEQRRDVELPVDMVMRVDVRRDLPGHVREHVELPLELQSLRSKVEIEDPIACGEVHVKAETQVRMFPCQSGCRRGSWHVDHEARAGHDPSFVRLDYSSVGPLVPAKVICVDDQTAFVRCNTGRIRRIAGCGRRWPEKHDGRHGGQLGEKVSAREPSRPSFQTNRAGPEVVRFL